MRETEIQPLLSFIFCVDQILLLLLSRQCVPLSVANTVPPDVESFDQVHQDNVKTGNAQKNAVSSLVEGFVVISVDVGCDNVSRLHKHVVQRRRDSSGSHGIAVLRVPGHQDCVAVRI